MIMMMGKRVFYSLKYRYMEAAVYMYIGGGGGRVGYVMV